MTVDIDLEYVRQEYNRMESDQSSCDGLGMRDGWMGAKLLITSSEQQGHFRVAFHHSSRSVGGSLLYVCAIWSTPAAAAADDDFQRVDRLKCDKHVTDVLALLPYWNFSLHFEISQTAQVGIWLDARRGKHEQQSRRFWLSLFFFFLWTHGPDYLLIIHDFSMTTFRAIWWAVSVAGKKKINKNSWRRKRRKITYTLAIFVRFFLFFVFHRWKGKWPPMRCGERNKNRLRCFLIIQQRLMAPYTSYYTWCARWGAQRIKMSQT